MFLVINVQDFTNANVGYPFRLLYSPIRPGLYLRFRFVSPTSSIAFAKKRFSDMNFFLTHLRLPLTIMLTNVCHFYLSECVVCASKRKSTFLGSKNFLDNLDYCLLSLATIHAFQAC